MDDTPSPRRSPSLATKVGLVLISLVALGVTGAWALRAEAGDPGVGSPFPTHHFEGY